MRWQKRLICSHETLNLPWFKIKHLKSEDGLIWPDEPGRLLFQFNSNKDWEEYSFLLVALRDLAERPQC